MELELCKCGAKPELMYERTMSNDFSEEYIVRVHCNKCMMLGPSSKKFWLEMPKPDEVDGCMECLEGRRRSVAKVTDEWNKFILEGRYHASLQ
jgi:hypothetical protein